MLDLQILAEQISHEVDRLWPGETTFGRGMALAEETGEVCRAMLKRDHARKVGVFKGRAPEAWTEEIRIEVAQTLGVLLNIAHREGFNVERMLTQVVETLRGRIE